MMKTGIAEDGTKLNDDDTELIVGNREKTLIALSGVIANSLFWLKYSSLYKKHGNAVIGVQARLYGAKSAVDVCVTIALAAVLAFPGTKIAYWIDLIGSVLVSLYMIRCGIKTILESVKRRQ